MRGGIVVMRVGLTSVIWPSLSLLLVRYEEGPFDVARLALQLFRKVPDDHQELMPVVKAEPNGPGVLCHRAQRVKQLPDPDIDHAIPLRIKQRQHRRGHRDGYTVQCGQCLEPRAL